MRIRITTSELEYYAKAKRDNVAIPVQGRLCKVVGITQDLMAGAASIPNTRYLPQWWVELSEV